MKDFETEGFLGGEADEIALWFVNQNPDLHTAYRELNRIARGHLRDKAAEVRLQSLLCALYFGRLLSLYEAVYILACRGMRADTETLLRSMTEINFKLQYAATSQAAAASLIMSDEHERLRLLRNAANHPHNRTDKEIEEHRELIEAVKRDLEANKAARLTTKDIAKALGREWEYDLKYAMLCQAAHGGPRDFHQNMQQGAHGKIEKLLWGPEHAEAPLHLATAMDFLLQGMTALPFLCLSADSPEYELWQSRVRQIMIRHALDSGPADGAP
jgi:hypothetical protein